MTETQQRLLYLLRREPGAFLAMLARLVRYGLLARLGRLASLIRPRP